jgi:hypothetical protein
VFADFVEIFVGSFSFEPHTSIIKPSLHKATNKLAFSTKTVPKMLIKFDIGDFHQTLAGTSVLQAYSSIIKPGVCKVINGFFYAFHEFC